MAAFTVGFVAGALCFPDPLYGKVEYPSGWGLVVAIILTGALLPFVLAGLIGVAALFSGKARTWRRPTHSSRPFSMRNPLLFYHFAGLLLAACGLGMVAASPLQGAGQFDQGALLLTGGLACYGGVRMAMKLCKHKLLDEQA
jgi:hypothetical protein